MPEMKRAFCLIKKKKHYPIYRFQAGKKKHYPVLKNSIFNCINLIRWKGRERRRKEGKGMIKVKEREEMK